MLSRLSAFSVLVLLLPLAAEPAAAAAPVGRRPLSPDDFYHLRDVTGPRVSPDGKWVAYEVKIAEREKDRVQGDLFMVPLAGGAPLRLTSTVKESESSPRFSPDGRYLAFLSSREGKTTQVWLLDRRGGEAVKLTSYKADVSDLAWSPDGKRLALVVADVDPDNPNPDAAKDDEKTPKPIVVKRLQFKQDGQGYLTDRRDHLYVFDLGTKASVQVTSGPGDDASPAWSPDGRLLAFVSNRTANPDANQNTDVFVVEPVAGAAPRALTTSPGSDGSPSWSPDGKSVVYVAGGDPGDLWYGPSHLAVVGREGGAPRELTRSLDRNAGAPEFTPDGRHILFLLEDRGTQQLARVPAAGGTLERIVSGERAVERFDQGPKGEIVVLESRFDRPFEVSRVEAKGGLAVLTDENGPFLAGIDFGKVERHVAQAAGGPPVDVFLTFPPGAPRDQRLPAILRIHGGPADQYRAEFMSEWQMLAAKGYLVIAANPRGSTGYGRDFSRAIWADWGNKDFDDVMAAVDKAVALGVADPDRLGVGGWSYGGILTDYVITKTDRFKAATSGASEVNYLANYGTDHYQYFWEAELGLPWKNVERWVEMSPFFHVEKVKTPTLILCGEDDVNVPLLNSEQLYQALRRLGVPTELVIYPGQHHGIQVPSYKKDRLERYIAWYDRYLAPKAAEAGAKL